VQDGIGAILDHARDARVPLAIEPLHPMYAADRACINTLEQALDLCDCARPRRSGLLGVAVDAYHVWWDPKLAAQIGAPAASACSPSMSATGWCRRRPAERPRHDGRRRDRPAADARLGRGAGFAGYSEVEIFSAEDWWKRDGGEVLDTCIGRHRSAV
jgi:sugar phosphate isomerase/epimerase